MTRNRALVVLALALALLVPAAGSPARAQNTGNADFSRFVALGDSLGAGFTNGGLVQGAQKNSVPALLAMQATGHGIEQPLVSEPGIPALLQLQGLSPVRVVPLPGSGHPLNALLPVPYNNLSVPGFRLGDALRNRERGPTDAATLVLRTQATQLEQALALQPTFALVWLGNNDVLAAATSGRVIEGVTLTPVAQFQADYTALVAALQGAGAKLVLANLPDVTSIPFVTTIPPILVNPATNQPVLGPDGAPIPLLGPDDKPLSPNDRVLLTASTPLSQGIGIPAFAGGTGRGLGNEFVLSASEAATVQARVDDYNAVIRGIAQSTGSALADINGLLRDASTTGFDIGGVTITSDYITGGAIGLDGVHPRPLGYAVAANEFIRAINETYDADIPEVDLFPFLFGSDASPIPSIPGELVSNVLFTRAAGRQLLDVLRVWEGTASTPAGPRGGGPAPTGAPPHRRSPMGRVHG